MGLASKFKNSASQTPQSAQPPLMSFEDYPPPQQDAGRYGAPPPERQTSQPSAPPEPQQYYGYAATPQPSQVETYTPSASYLYEMQGHTHPYAAQGQSLPYADQQAYARAQQSYVHSGGGGAGPGSYPDQQLYGRTQPGNVNSGGGGGGPAHYTQMLHQHASPMANSVDILAKKLDFIIQANGLRYFFDQAKFQAVLRKIASINFAEIAAEWKISKELAYDLAPLALYDIVFYCDDSGSMAFEENGERIDDLKLILAKLSPIATLFDDDGIMVRFMNSNVNGDGIRNAADVENLVSKVRFSGMTPLGTNMDRKVLQPFVLGQARSHSMEKPVLAIAITDGEPSGEDRGMIRHVIWRAKEALAHTQYGAGALAVQIAQVGKDAKTQRFLESLDKDPVVGQMIDCTSYYELEEEEFARRGVALTPELWLLKMCVGAIDPEYDAMDD